MRRLLSGLLSLLYPKRCPFCRKLIAEDECACQDCLDKLPRTQGEQQRQSFPFVELCLSPLYYEGALRKSFLRYKFSGAVAYSEIYSDIMAKCIDENQISCDIITWVSLSRQRLRRRGYDQARLLAEALSERSGTDCLRLLSKKRNNPAQSGLGGAEERRSNAAGAYMALTPELFRDKRVLLVDDIVTTGSTLSECARVLRKAGAGSVTAVTLARSRP